MYSSSKCLDCTPDKTQVVYTGVGKPLLFVRMNGSWYNVVGGWVSIIRSWRCQNGVTWFALSVRCHEELAMAVSLLLRCWQNSQGERTLGAFSVTKRWPLESPHAECLSPALTYSYRPDEGAWRPPGTRRSSKAYLRLNLASAVLLARRFCEQQDTPILAHSEKGVLR